MPHSSPTRSPDKLITLFPVAWTAKSDLPDDAWIAKHIPAAWSAKRDEPAAWTPNKPDIPPYVWTTSVRFRARPADGLRSPRRPRVVGKLQDHLAYPPRAMRAERAAAYLDMSTRTFFRLVDEGALPPPIKIRGVVTWDRLELDAAYENLKFGESENTVHKLLSKDEG
jgi:predicted DNA-binding transcriptional regulator AlpA